MTPIQFDTNLHAEGETTDVRPYALRQALAWWVGSELVRRHPDTLALIKTHPGGGQYDCLTVMQRTRKDESRLTSRAYLNMIEGGHITLVGLDDADYGEERFNWTEVLLAPNRRKYVVEQIERALGFPAPGVTPPTTPQSIGPRLISRLLSSTALDERDWIARHAVHDGVPEHFFALTPELEHSMLGAIYEDELHPAQAYWFLSAGDQFEGQPVGAVDTWRGLLWNSEGRQVDLLQRYKELDRSLDRLRMDVIPLP